MNWLNSARSLGGMGMPLLIWTTLVFCGSVAASVLFLTKRDRFLQIKKRWQLILTLLIVWTVHFGIIRLAIFKFLTLEHFYELWHLEATADKWETLLYIGVAFLEMGLCASLSILILSFIWVGTYRDLPNERPKKNDESSGSGDCDARMRPPRGEA